MNISVPSGLRPLLEDFTVAVMRTKPNDLVEYAANYFTQLHTSRQGQQDAGDTEMADLQTNEVVMGKQGWLVPSRTLYR